MAMVATPALRRALASNLGGLRSALVSAATTTIMPSLSLPTWFPGFLKAFLRGLVKKKVWPPSRQNFKMYVGGWAFMYSMLYIFFVRKGKSKEAEAEKKRKREYVEASLKNLVKYEGERKAEEAAAVPSKDKEPEPEDDSAEAVAARKKTVEDEKKKKKTAPDTKKMLSLLYDEVEAGNVTKIGVDPSLDWYKASVEILRSRVEAELQEFIDKTKLVTGNTTVGALEVKMEWSSSPDELAKLEEFRDGNKLQELLTTVKEQVVKAFGKNLIDKALIKEAKLVCKVVSAKRQAAMKRILSLFTPHAPKWIFGTMCLMGTECMWGFLFGFLQMMCNLAYELGPDTNQRAARMAMMIAAGFLVNWPMDMLGDTLVDGVEAKMQLGLRTAVMDSLLRQDREYFDHNQSGVLQERLNKDTEDLARTIIQQPKNLISAITRVAAKSAFLYNCSPQLFWLGISIPVPFCVILNTLGWKVIRKSHKKISKVNDQAAGSTAEILREISTVRQFGMENEERSRYEIIASWREQLEFSLKTVTKMIGYSMWMAFVFSRILNNYWGITFVSAGTLDAARLMLAVYQFDGIVWGARQIVDMFPAIASMMQPLARVSTLLDTIPKIEPHPEHPGGQLRPQKFEGRIEFDNVDFTYPSERQKQVLHGLTFTVEPQTKVAFVGKAGCGKSTSVTLIQRFYNASKGSVMLDGKPIGDYDVHHLRRHIGVVAQDNILFSTSIIENITYGMGQGHLPEASMAQVLEACDAANVTEFVKTFPNALYTFIGEKGVKLSGGQKQRLAIARAIIRKPTILLLDEATSALDSVNEKEVQKALDEMLLAHQGVAIVIAHRLTTVKNCNKIVVMDKGSKVEEGSHADLMQIEVKKEDDGEGGTKVLQGHYHTMWDTQMGEETFAEAKLMSDDQLAGKLKYLEDELARHKVEDDERKKGRPSKSV